MKGSAEFSPCGRYRYELRRTWHAGEPALCAWLALNPSYAGAIQNDTTVSKMCGFSQRWGFGGLVLVNMFALKSTDPKIMAADEEPRGPDNDEWLERMFADRRVARIVACWGNLPWLRSATPSWQSYVDRWALRLKRDHRSVCLGRTKIGEPRHPVRLGYHTDVEPYRVGPAGERDEHGARVGGILR